MTRRQLLAGAAAAAATAGLGFGWWRHGRELMQADERKPPATSATASDFWGLVFDAPDGRPIELKQMRGRPLLLNFWASWCPPCVKEMPLLEAFHRAHRAQGWQVLGLAVDGPTPVREFLARQPVSFPIGLAGLNGVDLSRSLGNTQGGLPFTAVFDAAGAVRARQLGALNEQHLAQWASPAPR